MSIRRLARLFSSTQWLKEGLKFTKSHEWFLFDPNTKTGKIGISNYAQAQLGEIIHVELPKIGKKFSKNESVAVIQSVKIAADVYTPVESTVKTINGEVSANPSLINDNPMESWLVEVSCQAEPTGLLTEEEYSKLVM